MKKCWKCGNENWDVRSNKELKSPPPRYAMVCLDCGSLDSIKCWEYWQWINNKVSKNIKNI